MKETNSSSFRVSLVDFSWYAQNVPCESACPVSTPAGRYVRNICQGDMEKAYLAAREPNPLMHVCARICAHPCEDQCRRGKIDEPISIRHLKRTISDYWAQLSEDKKPALLVEKKREETIAVIGAGPAGMAAATVLLKKGYGVTIFEASDALGGMLIDGIPPYRLPREVIGWDYAFITDYGGTIKTNVALGKDFTLEDLEREGFAAVFIGIGATQGLSLPTLEGADLPGVHIGIEFLKAFNRGEETELGQKVAIIGGGNVAIDVARSVRRLPTQGERREITMLVLEERQEMLAFEDEIHEALEENITIINSVGPKRFIDKEGRVGGVETLRAICVYDETGCFNPQFANGSENTFEADTVLVAIGQRPEVSCLEGILELTPRGTIQFDPDTMATSRKGVFAGGDGARGPRVVIDAAADGIRAAESIDHYISSEQPMQRRATMRAVSAEDLPPVANRVCRQPVPTVPPPKRKPSLEVSQSYSMKAARKEAARCLDCYVQTVFESERCILCGGCVDVCPMRCLRLLDIAAISGDEHVTRAVKARYALSAEPVSAGTGTAILKDEEKCIRCGLCEKRCPTGTITMEYFSIESSKEGSRGE